MLYYYVGRNNLPEDVPIIEDPTVLIPMCNITGTEFQCKVLNDIEHGRYKDSTRFYDRFGGELYYDDMSSGSKILFALEQFPDKILNCEECGSNALRLISYLAECHIFIPSSRGKICVASPVEVIYNGEYYKSTSWLNEFL